MHALRVYVSRNDGLYLSIRKGADSALEHLRELGYVTDWIVIDLELPGSGKRNGLQLTAEIRAEEEEYGQRSNIVWATDIADGGTGPISKAANALGISKIVNRPYDVITLLEELKKETVFLD